LLLVKGETRMAKQRRSAKTGRFVTAAYAKKHPSTTIIETGKFNKKKKRP
jgi:hypothetical protein